MSSEEDLTPLEKLIAAFGGSTLPNLETTGTIGKRDIFKALTIINGVTEEELEERIPRGSKFKSKKSRSEVIEEAQAQSEALSVLLFALINPSTETTT